MVAKEKQNSKLSFNQTIENRNTSSIEYNDLKKCTELTEDDEESNDDEDAYSSEEEPEKAVERELEWDDESLEIKEKKLQIDLIGSILNFEINFFDIFRLNSSI